MTEPMSIYVPKLEFKDGRWIDGQGGVYTVQACDNGWIITCLNAGYKRAGVWSQSKYSFINDAYGISTETIGGSG